LETQTTWRTRPRGDLPAREDALDLELLPPEAVRFVPVDLCRTERAISELNLSDALSFALPGWTVELPKSGDLADPAPDRDRLLLENRANDPEIHRSPE
jgi:hypothetical protein